VRYRKALPPLALASFLAIAVLAPGCAPGRFERYPARGSSPNVDLLVVSAESLVPQAVRLAAFKTRSGTRTAVVTTGGIEAKYKGSDLAEKIRGCATDYWKRKHISSLLLVGDASQVPPRYVFCPNTTAGQGVEESPEMDSARKAKDPLEYERYYVPTDLYYANLVDDWDINRNRVYGEPAASTGLDRDEGGFTSQITVGRIPARDPGDLDGVVEKIEKYRPTQTCSALVISATVDMGSLFDGDRVSQNIVAGLGGGVQATIVTEGAKATSPAEIAGLLDAGGFGLVAAVAHGLPFGIVTESAERQRVFDAHRVNPGEAKNILAMSEEIERSTWYGSALAPTLLDTGKASGLQNSRYFFFMGFGCYISAIDYPPHYSINEQLVMQPHGAIAACGLSRDVLDVTPGVYQGALDATGGLQFEVGTRIINNLCVAKAQFGRAVADSVSEYAGRHPELLKLPDHRRALFGMMLIGDPTLRLLI
jgi:hypothetical protein